jgi:hypothetical protein
VAIEIIEQIKAIVEKDDRSKMDTFEQWQQPILQALRLLKSSI